MGDFNIQFENYIKYYRRNGNSHWRDSLFTKINNLQLIDTVALYQDITPTTPYNTFIPKQQQSSPTRIDYIWISRDLLDETINSNNYNSELYSSDHLGVYISFYTNNLFKQKSIANLKQQKIYKTIFHYDKMNQEKWKEFADTVDLHHQTLQLNNMSINNSRDLNRYWNNIQACIRNAAFAKIPNHNSVNQHKERNPKYLTDIYYDIRHINKIIMRYNIKSWNRNKPRLSTDWTMVEKQLLSLSNKISYHIDLPAYISDNNYNSIKHTILDLKNTMVTKAKLLELKHRDEQIKKYNNLHCENFTDDKGSMIKSCLEKDNKKIVIDRLLTTIDGVDHLITDPPEI